MRALLDLEMMTLEHPGRLQDAPELQLPPLTADVRGTERSGEFSRFGLQGQLRVGQRAQLFGEDPMRRGAIAIDLAQFRVDLGQ